MSNDLLSRSERTTFGQAIRRDKERAAMNTPTPEVPADLCGCHPSHHRYDEHGGKRCLACDAEWPALEVPAAAALPDWNSLPEAARVRACQLPEFYGVDEWNSGQCALEVYNAIRDLTPPDVFPLFRPEMPALPDDVVVRPETSGPYEARICKDTPADCCDYGVVSLSEGREVCRVWREQDARAIAAALKARPAAPAEPVGAASLRVFRLWDGWGIDDETSTPFIPIARCMSERTANLLADALKARPAAPAEPVRVKVKPLEWEQPDGPEGTAWLGHGTEMCQYYIRFDTETASYWMPGERPLSDDDDSAEEYLALADAKAAAQADYERRILSALSPPAADASGVADAQQTNCGCCGELKTTPLRVDWLGGYICLTCADQKLHELKPQPSPGVAQDDLVGRLRKPYLSEETMQQWDRWRASILAGNTGSHPRDCFESLLDVIDQERDEAATRLKDLQKAHTQLKTSRDKDGETIEGLRGEVEKADRAAQYYLNLYDKACGNPQQASSTDLEDRLTAAEAKLAGALGALRTAEAALERADQFITNGRALGFIRMPDASTPDTAHETPGLVEDALTRVRAALSAPAAPEMGGVDAE
jgi:hypothetical protein